MFGIGLGVKFGEEFGIKWGIELHLLVDLSTLSSFS
jgi:hypothetical protein